MELVLPSTNRAGHILAKVACQRVTDGKPSILFAAVPAVAEIIFGLAGSFDPEIIRCVQLHLNDIAKEGFYSSSEDVRKIIALSSGEEESLNVWMSGAPKERLRKIKSCMASSRSASTLYQIGQKYERLEDFVLAAAHYIKAAEKKSRLARERLTYLRDSEAIRGRPRDAIEVGNLYAGLLFSVNDAERGKWYLTAGVSYQNGYGVTRDFRAAAKLFRIAAELGCEGERFLVEIANSPHLTQMDANAIGTMYAYGLGVFDDFERALGWHEHAAEMDPKTLHAAIAHKSIGSIAERVGDFEQAARSYQQSIDGGCLTARPQLEELMTFSKPSREVRKVMDREFILWLRKNGKNLLTYRDLSNNTLVMRAVNYGQLKNTARLKMVGVPHDEDFQFFDSEATQSKVTHLQSLTTILVRDLRKESARVLCEAISGKWHDTQEETRRVIAELAERPLIAPLLELAKLAALGSHRLSRREKFSSSDYDSDDDFNEPLSTHYQLSIRVDRSKGNISGMYYEGVNGFKSRRAGGIYDRGYSWSENTIFFGWAGETWTRGTFLHELTHFLAYEVFNNKCLPYPPTSFIHRQEFLQITKSIEAKFKQPNTPVFTEELDKVVGNIFSSPLYTNEIDYQAELIVRIPELIARGKEGVEAEIRTHLPELMAYYENVFLPKVRAHTESMREIALGHWPLEIFPE